MQPKTRPRYTIARSVDALRIAIPVKRNWLAIVATCGWLMLVAGAVLGGHEKHAATGGKVVLCLMLAYGLLLLLWQLFGQEVIIDDGAALTYRIELFGSGYSRNYATDRISSLRTIDFSVRWFSWRRDRLPPFWGERAGPIAFDCGTRAVCIAPSLTPAEAQEVLAILKQRLPAGAFAARASTAQ